jgi:hypothetical protein
VVFFVKNTRIPHAINGIGYECSMKVIKQKFTESFMGIKEPCQVNSFFRKLPREQCQIMILKKECESNTMLCSGDTCFFDGTPSPRYAWWDETYNHGFVCSIKPVSVIGKNLDSQLFSKSFTVNYLFVN